MPIDQCTPCSACAIDAAVCSNQIFKRQVLLTLCNIAGLANNTVVPLDTVTVAFGAIANTYGATGFIPGGGIVRSLQLTNGTNVPVQISYDGTDDNGPVVLAGQTLPLNYGDSKLYLNQTSDIYIKYPGSAPSSGAFYIGGYR